MGLSEYWSDRAGIINQSDTTRAALSKQIEQPSDDNAEEAIGELRELARLANESADHIERNL